MNQKNDLHRLIHSLTKNEKRYFKQLASNHVIKDVNKYVLLFNAIVKQNEYNETEVKKKTKLVIAESGFREAKRYLYEIILKALDNYHSESTINATLKKKARYARMLFNKNLYDQCEKQLLKVEKTALLYDEFEVLLEINQLKSKLYLATSYSKVMESNIKLIYENELIYLKNMQKNAQYKYLNALFFYNLRKRKYTQSQPESIEYYRKIISNPLLQDEKEANSVQAKSFYYNIQGVYNQLIQQPKKSEHIYKKQIALFEQYPGFIEENQTLYIAILSNLINSYNVRKQFNESMMCIQKIELLKTRNELEEVYKFTILNSRKLDTFANSFEFTKAFTVITVIENGIKKYGKKLSEFHMTILSFNIAYLYFITKNYKRVLFYTNNIINLPSIDLFQNVQSFAKVLNLMVHYELNNWEHLYNNASTGLRMLKTKESKSTFYFYFLSFLKNLNKGVKIAETKKMFEKFKEECIIISQTQKNNTFFEYIDFISWLDSKIQNKSFEEMLKIKHIAFINQLSGNN